MAGFIDVRISDQGLISAKQNGQPFDIQRNMSGCEWFRPFDIQTFYHTFVRLLG
jgi:hypothetical protein